MIDPEKRKKRACFTGHRPDYETGKIGMWKEEQVRDSLMRCIEKLYLEGINTFVSGMALGVDTIAAECVIAFRGTHQDVRLFAGVPFDGQSNLWKDEDKNKYAVHTIL